MSAEDFLKRIQQQMGRDAKELVDQTPTGLWLDDVRMAPEGWHWVTTAPETIEALQSSSYDVVSLDHDLGAPENGTGYDVLVWIERTIFEGHWRTTVPELRIHSANPVGRANMARAVASIYRLAAERLG